MDTPAKTGRPEAPAGHGFTVPYMAMWSEEEELPLKVVERPGRGIGLADEMMGDRDRYGVLWLRVTSRPGVGRPRFGVMHSSRQRRAMLRMLCQVCGQPADSDDDGTLWLLPNYHEDRPGWPDGFVFAEPPICLPCARLSVRVCPALRRDRIVVRADSAPLWGVKGMVYRGGNPGPVPVADELVRFGTPAIRWVLGELLIRKLFDCAVVDLDRDRS